MPVPRFPSRRRRPVITAAVALLAVTLQALPAGAAPAGPAGVDAKRAEAARIADQLARQRDQMSALVEELNLAGIEADRRAAEVAAATEDLRQSEEAVGRARGVLKVRLVDAYASGGPPNEVIAVFVGGPAEEIAVRRTYVNAVAGRERADIDGLEAAIEAQDARRREVETAESAAAEVLDRVQGRRRATEQAVADRQETLDQVNGELAVLVEEERSQRAEDEAARAKVELEARQAREAVTAANQARLAAEEASRAAARATTTTTRRPATDAAPSSSPAPVRPPTPPSTAGPPADPGGTEAPAGPIRPPADGAEVAVAEAKRQLGKPYQWGGSGPGSFDCSGLTSFAWRAAGKSLPHSSRAQMDATARVPIGEIQPGDLVFYGTPVHHVGIYAGAGQMVEASETGTPVRMASIYRRDLVGVGRVK